jgi:hypothetical protein
MAATVQATAKKTNSLPSHHLSPAQAPVSNLGGHGEYQKGLSESPCLSKHLLQVEASFSGGGL